MYSHRNCRRPNEWHRANCNYGPPSCRPTHGILVSTQRVSSAFVSHIPPGYAVQLGVNQRNQAFERRLVAIVPGHQQLGDVVRRSSRHSLRVKDSNQCGPELYACAVRLVERSRRWREKTRRAPYRFLSRFPHIQASKNRKRGNVVQILLVKSISWHSRGERIHSGNDL